MISAEKFGGTPCPEDEYEECVRTPPVGHCDCDGNSYDHCGVCGGNDICKGCDGKYYTTFRGHISYESEKHLYLGSGIKPIRNKCGECGGIFSDECSKKMKLMASKKEKRSKYQGKLVPTVFVVLFVFFMVAVFVCMNKSKKKYQAIPTEEISEGEKYHKSVILNF